MANNYTLFSECVSDLTPQEADWLKNQFDTEKLEVLSDMLGQIENPDIADSPDEYPLTEDEIGFAPALDLWAQRKDFVALAAYVDFGCLGLGIDLRGSDMFIYSEEAGNVDALLDIMQAFLAKFRPDDCFTMEWAHTCEKPRVGEFGGGAAFVTATGQQFINTGTWCGRRRTECTPGGKWEWANLVNAALDNMPKQHNVARGYLARILKKLPIEILREI